MKTINLQKPNLFLNIVREKCPHCHRGDIFQKDKGLINMPAMRDECPDCHYRFEREPGYFLGAMYISYGIAVFSGIITFLLLHFLAPGLATIYIPITIIFVILTISRKNFKLSRTIYMYMFPW